MREDLQSLEELHGRAPIQLAAEELICTTISENDNNKNEDMSMWAVARRNVLCRDDDECVICFQVI